MSTVQRLTFREKQSGVAWQKLIRDKAAARYKGKEWWAGADLSLKKAVVRETTRAVAKKIIHEYEWLGTLPNCTRYYGIFFDGWACGGVACWSQGGGGANVFAHMELGVERAEMSYLVRGACTHWTPKGTASKLISITLREEAKKGSAVAIAYSDTDAGEIGTVYQATNWLCIGRGAASVVEFVHKKSGRIYNQKIVQDMRQRAGKMGSMTFKEGTELLLRSGFTSQKINPKYRYVYIMAKGEKRKQILRKIQKKITPYPKRAPVEGSADQVEEGGSNPTRTLQK